MFGFLYQNYWNFYNEETANDNTMDEPLKGIHSAFINLIVRRLRDINVETVLARDSSLKIGMKRKDGSFDGIIGSVQENVSKISFGQC